MSENDVYPYTPKIAILSGENEDTFPECRGSPFSDTPMEGRTSADLPT